ncbi:MAG TPA: DUF4382 domain-containing protein [Gammaproteobacteria bacterium]|nr:DUF4382 domain-containing protein [Gammaproteobacteria bacterium]
MRKPNRLFSFMAIPLISLFLFSCGGGGGGDTAATGTVSPAGTGTVTLLVTDAPSDDFSAINLTVTQAELMSDRGSVILFSGNKTFDLLQLATATEIFSVTDVPAGSYDKIRLTLTNIELVMKDGSTASPALPGNGKLDLNPRGSFDVAAGDSLMLQLDMDAEKSIKVTGTGNAMRYQFRPVVFVKVVNNSADTKLVRLQGEAYNLDYTGGSFDLCYIDAQGHALDDDSQDGNPYCVKVDAATAPASFFDAGGNPADINMISRGDIVTAVGRFAMRNPGVSPSSQDDGQDSRSEDSDGDRNDDADLNDTNSQSSHDNHDDQSQDHDASDHDSSDDDSSDDGDHRKLVLVAEVIWPGDFEQVVGVARSPLQNDVDKGDWFRFLALPGQTDLDGNPIDSEAALAVLVQNGTKLFSRQGEALTTDAIADGIPARVDGMFDTRPGDLKSALIILDTDALLTQLTGIIGSVETDYSGMILQADSGDRCVVFKDGMRVFKTYLDDENNISFEQRLVFDLAAGQMADVFGSENTVTGCLEAETVIYEEEMVVPQPLP